MQQLEEDEQRMRDCMGHMMTLQDPAGPIANNAQRKFIFNDSVQMLHDFFKEKTGTDKFADNVNAIPTYTTSTIGTALSKR